MYKVKFKLRNVATIAACLAVTTFASCEPGDEPVDNGADITSFTFDGIVGEAVIDKDALTVTATADETVDLEFIIAELTLSDGATAMRHNSEVIEGQIFDFSEPSTIIVKSSDSRLTNIWTVTVTKESSGNRLFNVKSGMVVYNYKEASNDEATHTLIFDDYGERLKITRLAPRWNGSDELRFDVEIIDNIAGKRYSYEQDLYPDYEEETYYGGDRFGSIYHCWPVDDDINWGERENLQILSNQTIAEKSCSAFSFTSGADGSEYEYANWNNIAFRMYCNAAGYESELTAISFSTSIPDNSFVPWGNDKPEQE